MPQAQTKEKVSHKISAIVYCEPTSGIAHNHTLTTEFSFKHSRLVIPHATHCLQMHMCVYVCAPLRVDAFSFIILFKIARLCVYCFNCWWCSTVLQVRKFIFYNLYIFQTHTKLRLHIHKCGYIWYTSARGKVQCTSENSNIGHNDVILFDPNIDVRHTYTQSKSINIDLRICRELKESLTRI